MRKRSLGRIGPEVSALGLGCMGMSDLYGPADRAESIATVHAALDAGITLFDTGDFYGMGHNEMLLREALQGRRDRVLVSVKFGAQRDPAGGWLGVDGRPQAVKTSLAYTLKRLGTDYVDVYRMARMDPAVPIEDTIGAIADMVKAGHVRHVGLSEAGAATIRRAHAVHPITDLQIEYPAVTGDRGGILPAARGWDRDHRHGVLSGPAGGTGRRNGPCRPATSAPTARASRATTSRTTWAWSRRCARWPPSGARRWRRSRSRGRSRAARTSSRWWARGGATAWRRRWARSRSC
jgi:aryl-alcohol dehydrogenase-like predicted oxidoreductase